MNALVISHSYPPLNTVASARPYSFARALVDAGVAVTVLTSRKTEAMGDLSLAHDPYGIRMVEIPFDEAFRTRWARMSWTARAARELRSDRMPDRVDLVLSSHGPSSSHVLGHLASRRWTDTFWLADYRDPWTTATYDRVPRRLDPLLRRVEGRIVSRADLVSTTSEGFARLIRAVVPDVPQILVPNGYDRPLATEQTPDPTASRRPRTILWTGRLYARRLESVRCFLTALADVATGDVTPDDLRVLFLGPNVELALDLARTLGVADFVEGPGMKSRDEVYAAQDACDALLLALDDHGARQGILTAKVYEYLAARPPILLVGPGPSTELAALVSGCGAGVCPGSDCAAIAAAIRTIARGEGTSLADRRRDRIARYHRPRIARSLMASLVERGVPIPTAPSSPEEAHG